MNRSRRAAPLALALVSACVGPPGQPPVVTAPPAPGQLVLPPPPTAVSADAFRLSGPPQQGALLTGTVPPGTALLTLDGKTVRFDRDGRFIIGFGRDFGPAAVLQARLADGRVLAHALAVRPRAWDISVLSTLSRGTTPSPAYQRIRSAELAQIEAARSMPVESDGWRQAFRWPATGRISTLFGSQRIYAGGVRGSFHGGIDIARPTGTVVTAPADGTVILATTGHPFSLEGNMVMIGHGMGLDSQLMHLSRIDVRVGQAVRRGDPIGLVGMTGRATGPHLHWGLMWQGQRLDPLLVAGPMPDAAATSPPLTLPAAP